MATVSQISRDPALETSLFWDQYKMPIMAIIAVLALGALGFAGYQVYTQRRAADAAALLAGAKTPQEFQQVIDRYPGSGPAASAYLLLATEERAKKNYAEANATLHKFIDQFPKHELITTAWMGVAANLDSLGKNDEALSTYQRLVAEYPQSFNAPLALLSEVPLLKAKGRPDEARRACETVLSQYRDSVLMSEALRELQKLPKSATPAAQPKPAAPAR
ncbi:MAG: tetratricopeptide repeat protein [Chthoniobacterales bacterium]|nr:tetratricopeptide repeat protein [Chthoniobacterales bacterium]